MIAKIAWKNIKFKPLNTLLSVVLLTTSIAIITVLVLLQNQFENKFNKNIDNIDMVLGAQGSPLQLILSAVYQIDAPTGNISYKEAKTWINHPFVSTAVPLAFGDNYKGYKIVGTDTSYVQHYQLKLSRGKFFHKNFEVVVGAEIAEKLQLKIGDTFFGSHGEAAEGEVHDHQAYTIVGIAEATGKVTDNIILCSIPSVWLMHHAEEGEETHAEEEHVHTEHCNHDHESEEINEDEQEITAVLIKFKNKMGIVTWPRIIAQNTKMQAVSPAYEVNRLFELFGIGLEALQYLALGIMLISGISIFVALYNTLKERKYEFALMRINGASRWQLVQLVVMESMILCILGYIFGKIIGTVALYYISQSSSNSFKMSFNPFTFQTATEGWIILLTLTIGLVAALIPAIKAYTLNISKTLAHA